MVDHGGGCGDCAPSERFWTGSWDAWVGGTCGGVVATLARDALPESGSPPGRRVTECQSGHDASLRNPARSGRRSISEAITAGSILRCWLVVVDPNHRRGRRVLERVVWRTSR